MQRRNPNSLNLGLALVAAVIVLIAPAVYADPPNRAARLAYVNGPVSLAPAGLPDEWGEAFVNRPITVGDRLWADPGGRAEIRLGSTAMRIDGNTSLDILALDDRMLQVSIEQGRAQIRTRGGQGSQAEIDTPAAAIVISTASDVRVDVDPASGRTSILVRQGRANVNTPNDSFDLASGESTRIDADGRYYSIGRAGPRDAFDQFAYTRDSRWREPRYVSVEMTGYEDLDQYGAWQPSGEYGNVWFPRTVSSDWAPYRDGRWMWVEPWGWTWVDNAPWGFAPFHYGRWVQVGPRWGWWPGERVAQPVYAPALVAFFGGDGFGVSVSVGAAPAVGWFPLGYRDPYIPWYAASSSYRRNVNVAYVRDPVVMNQVVNVNVTNVNVTTVNNFRYAHRDRAQAATVVPRTVFVAAQPVRAAAVAVPVQRVASANVMVGAAPVAPERQSVIGNAGRAERAPRGERNQKPVVAVNAPAPPSARFEQRQAESTREPNKPFEVKPIAPREDRRPDATRSAGAAPQGAPATTVATPSNREVQVIRPKAPESREARDRGARPDRNEQAQQAPQPGAAPASPQTSRTPPGNDRDQTAKGGQPPPAGAAAPQPPQQAAQPQRDDKGGQQREAQQREAQQREAQQKGAQQREAQQREAQERQTQQREAQQREAQKSAAQQREAQERQSQQREAQQREAQQREAQKNAAQQREAQERQAQQREAQQKGEAQKSAAQQREAQERQAQQRAAQQKGEAPKSAAQQREAQERQAQQREAQQKGEAPKSAAQQREAQQREAQKNAAQQREAQEREALQRAAPPQSSGQGRGNGSEPQSRSRGTANEPQAEDRDRDDRGRPDRKG